MKTITNFREMLSSLHADTIQKRVIAVCPTDQATRYALDKARAEGICTVLETNGEPEAAARQAVEMIRRGEGDMLMKGHINTDTLLRAILDKETGILEKGSVLTHIAVVEIPTYHKLLFLSDAAVIPYPNLEQRIAQARYMVQAMHNFGIQQPRIALLHCSEKTDLRHFPFLEQYTQLKEMAAKGEFGDCIIDGPMDVRSACSPEAMRAKDQQSPVAGDADAIIVPDIEAGNIFYKTAALFAGARMAGILKGTRVPVVANSRADSGETKFIALAAALRTIE